MAGREVTEEMTAQMPETEAEKTAGKPAKKITAEMPAETETAKTAGKPAKKRTAKSEKKPGIEEAFTRLDQITEEMEQSDITLEDSFRLFQEGMELVKQCDGMLQDVEKKMVVLEETLTEV